MARSQPLVASSPVDPRQDGWPCRGAHLSGREKSNQYASWTSCKKCGLRLSYVVKTSRGHGDSRAVGPAPEIVAMAQDELQQIYQPAEMNEKIFMGKVMEIKGRSLVLSRGHGSLQVQIRADQPRGRDLLGETTSRTTTTGYAARTPSTRTPPSALPTPTRSTRSVSPAPSFAPSAASPKAAAKAKARAASVPVQEPIDEEDLMVVPEGPGVEVLSD